MNRDEILYEQMSEVYDIAMEGWLANRQEAKEKEARDAYLNEMLCNGKLYRDPTPSEMQRVLSAVKRERDLIISEPKFKQSVKNYVEKANAEYGPSYESYDVNKFFSRNLTIEEGYYIPVINGPEADQDFCIWSGIVFDLVNILEKKYPEFHDFSFSTGDGDEGCVYVTGVRAKSLSELPKERIDMAINQWKTVHKQVPKKRGFFEMRDAILKRR